MSKFKIGLYVNTKNGSKLLKIVQKDIETFQEAERLCEEKNKALGVGESVPLGAKSYMFE